MFKRKKGFAVSTLVGVGLVASIVIGGIFAAGSISNLLELIYTNWWTTFLIFQGIGITSVFIINSYQDDPKWKTDIAGWLLITGVFFLIVFAPNISASVTGYEADLNVGVYNPAFKDPRIQTITVDNFDTGGPLSVKPLNIFWPSDEVQINGEVECGGEVVDTVSFGISVGEQTDTEGTTKITGLPSGDYCSVTVVGEKDSQSIGTETTTFKVP